MTATAVSFDTYPTVIAAIKHIIIYSNWNVPEYICYSKCCNQGYNYPQQLVCDWIHLSIANAAIKDTTIHNNWCVIGYIYLQQMLQSWIQLSTANAVIKDTSIHSKCCDHGYNYPQQLVCG